MAVRTVAQGTPAEQLQEADRAWRAARANMAASANDVRDAALAFVIAARLAGRYREALFVGKDAEARLQKTPAALAAVEAHVCMACLDAGEIDEAERLLARASARGAVDDDAAAAVARAEGNVHLARRRFSEAALAFARGLSRTKDPLERTIAQYNIAEANIRLGKFAEARALFAEARVVKEQINDRWGLSFVRWGLGLCALHDGDAAGALEHATAGIDIVRTLADPKITSRLYTLRARCLLKVGKLADAESAVRDAARESTRAALPRERADAQLALAEVLLALGQRARAKAAAEQAREIAERGGVLELVSEANALLSAQ